jgi:hypothetical protein
MLYIQGFEMLKLEIPEGRGFLTCETAELLLSPSDWIDKWYGVHLQSNKMTKDVGDGRILSIPELKASISYLYGLLALLVFSNAVKAAPLEEETRLVYMMVLIPLTALLNHCASW